MLLGTCLPSCVMFADVKLPIQKAVGYAIAPFSMHTPIAYLVSVAHTASEA